ncbi:uncharacterized membrane-anchored protein [Rhizobium subbaraonis]|uniref:Uncharacterized membrane-anchored protein n=1 Tax=Rhizobium subbaraonis TaxID=908946 RepID=A0A285UCG4_9HYPH|nr:GDYXXLXY domain-containing protein [Rhizobium subbaraonis]SOC38266.1 uncharacterized membrane-anchored protein [Rhizobium subbaraonis]
MTNSVMAWRISPFVAAVMAALIQTAVLGYMVESRATILRNGVEVRLKTVPVDPRDLMRGDYVTLSYPMSRIDGALVEGEVPKVSGRHLLFVRLAPGPDGLWDAREASFEALPAVSGTVVVRTLPFEFYAGSDGAVGDFISVTYGIERFYVPEGEGRVLETARNAQALEVVARVSPQGQMQVRQILLNGAPAYDEPLY